MKTKEADGGLIYQVAEVFKELKLEKAKRPQGENIKAQMSKLGDTIYEAYQVELLKEWRHTSFRTVFSLLSGVN